MGSFGGYTISAGRLGTFQSCKWRCSDIKLSYQITNKILILEEGI